MKSIMLIDGSKLTYHEEGVEYFPAGHSIKVRGTIEKILANIKGIEIYLLGGGEVSFLRNYGEVEYEGEFNLTKVQEEILREGIIEDNWLLQEVRFWDGIEIRQRNDKEDKLLCNIRASMWDIKLQVGGDF